MKNKPSINQNQATDTLPDLRNPGILFRAILISCIFAVSQAVFISDHWRQVQPAIINIATLGAPILFVSIVLIMLLHRLLLMVSYLHGVLCINLICIGISLAIYSYGGNLLASASLHDDFYGAFQFLLAAVLNCNLTLAYFRLRARLLQDALNDARLRMLRARIRPHFFFNSINAVLSIVRHHPRQAETALEDMSDMFRMAMSDAKDFIKLEEEVKLCQQYLNLEQLRMGNRLHVDWQLLNLSDNILIPRLMLQPLLENAVYHGIEPLLQGGTIQVIIEQHGDRIKCSVINPCSQQSDKPAHSGNKMALENIRERLQLLFDDARYRVTRDADSYRVDITLPYIKEKRNERRSTPYADSDR